MRKRRKRGSNRYIATHFLPPNRARIIARQGEVGRLPQISTPRGVLTLQANEVVIMSQFKFTDMEDQLPPLIPRCAITRYIPWLTPSRMRHLDCAGLGPTRIKSGKTVIYPTSDLLAWLDQRSEVIQGGGEGQPAPAAPAPQNQPKPRRGRPRKFGQEVRK